MQPALRLLAFPFLAWTATSCSSDAPGSSADPEPEAEIKIELDVSLGTKIPTVAFAEWSASLDRSELQKAEVHYALEDGTKELVAPVDLERDAIDGNAVAFRTPLLGMKQRSKYTVYVELETKAGLQRSKEATVTAGFLPAQTPRVQVEDFDASKLYGGFTVACSGPGGGESWSFIWDADGDIVWAFPLAETELEACTRARLSYDGRFLWVGDLNLIGTGGALAKIDLTGEQPAVSYSLLGRHHDFAILPNGNILYFREEESEETVAGATRDVLYEFDPETEQSTSIYDEITDFAAVIGDTPAHTNYIAYVPHLNAISFSMLTSNTIGLVSYPEGDLLATFGGTASDFDMNWTKQHGHQVLEDELLVFSNEGTKLNSVVLQYQIDLEASSSKLASEYVSDDQTPTFGDVKRLGNDNLLITYSNVGAIQEVSSDGQLLRRTKTVGIGYVEHRSSLYGPPPPFAD
jgi:hypothetical protein